MALKYFHYYYCNMAWIPLMWSDYWSTSTKHKLNICIFKVFQSHFIPWEKRGERNLSSNLPTEIFLYISIKLEIHACSNPSPLFPNIVSTQCFNMKYSELFQHWTQAHFACVMWTMATRIHDCFFLTKGHKIVEVLALLTTKLSSSKMYKVRMLFSIQWTLI